MQHEFQINFEKISKRKWMNAHFYLLLLCIKLGVGSSKHLVVLIFHLGAIKPLQDFTSKFKKNEKSNLKLENNVENMMEI